MNRLGGTHTTSTVGAELKRLRAERNWSLRVLGTRTHIDFSFLSRVENGERRASLAVVERLDAELDAGGTLIAAWVSENRVARPAQLPAAPTRFLGRDSQLAELTRVLSDRPPVASTVIAIDGPAGAGKTALALRCAHDVASRFFDGQLYVDLGGFAASRADVAEPAGVLRWFCIALGAEPGAIPAGTAERAALYRSLLADRRVLVVLDNAADSRHVEHLLPGTGRCAAIVTSRRALTGLTALTDAHRLAVGPLTEPAAVTLLTQLIGAQRADQAPDAVLAVTRLCGYLPLALRIAAERAIAHPERPLRTFVADLSSTRRLDYLETGDSPGVRSVISWSYTQLSTDAARTFRLLAIPGVPTINASTTAALAGTDLATARRNLHDLDRLHLVDLERNDTVRLNGLLRAYAQEQSWAEDEPGDRAAALDRLIAWHMPTVREALSAGSGDRIDQSGRHESALRDIVGLAESALAGRLPGGTWQCAAALWDCLLIRQGYGNRSVTEPIEGSTVRAGSLPGGEIAMSGSINHAIPRQVPPGFGHDLYNHAIGQKPDTADQHGLAWTLAGAALVAVCCDDDALAQEFADQAQEMLATTGDPNGHAATLQVVSALQRANDQAELDSAVVADAARLVAQTAAQRGASPPGRTPLGADVARDDAHGHASTG